MEWIVYAYAISGKTIHDFYEVSESHPPTFCYHHCLMYQDSDTMVHARAHLTHVLFIGYDSST